MITASTDMIDIRCVYHRTIAIHTENQLIVIGEEIWRAQQYADVTDVIVRYDPDISTYGSMTIQNQDDHILITQNDRTIVYDKEISASSSLPQNITLLLLDMSYTHDINTIKKAQPQSIIIMPTINQENAIIRASDMMREGIVIPKYYKAWQYTSIDTP